MLSLKCFILVLLEVAGLLVENCFTYDADYRLSTNHKPKSYELEILVNPSILEYNGTVTIYFSTKNRTNNIRLHASPNFLTIKQITLNDQIICSVSHPSTSLETTTEIVTITCKDMINASDHNKITISYQGLYLPHVKIHLYDGMGLKRGSYNKVENKSQTFVATQFEPIFARRAFPCFDEPQFKAEFNVTIIHPEHYRAIFNTPVYSEVVENGFMYSKFEKTPIMSTYVVAFVVSKLQSPTAIVPKMKRQDSPENMQIYVISNELDHIVTLNTYGGVLVDALQNWLDISYEELGIKKLDFVVLPILYTGSIPSWGLISFHEIDILDDGDNTSPEKKQFIISKISYELALQWFGDYVSPDWWSNVWLKEAFAGYFQYLIPDQAANLQMERKRQFITEYVHPGLYSDSPYPFGQPLSSKMEDIFFQDDIAAKIWTVNYQKGSCLIRMIESIMGEQKFRKAVQTYLRENKYKNTNPTILLKTLDNFYNGSGLTLTKIMDNWIYQPGYPLVSVFLNEDGKSVKIQQAEYNSGTKNKTTWYVPISYTTSSEKNFDVKVKHFIFNEPLNIELEDKSWIIVNLQQSGFYRVNYDNELWKRIIAVLKSTEMKEIHVSNRAQLIDDAFTLAKKGLISYNIAFELLEYIKAEIEYEPWYTAGIWIKEMTFLLRPLKDKQYLQKFKLTALGWIKEAFPNEINATTHLQKLTKNLIFELKNILTKSSSLEQSENIFDIAEKRINGNPNIKTVLCRGLQMNNNSKNTYDLFLDIYRNSTSAFERKQILSTIECFDDPNNLEMYLLETIAENSQFSEKDVKIVYESVYKNSHFGVEVYFRFLKKHLNDILNKYKFLNISELLVKAADRIMNDKQLYELKEIAEKYQDVENMKLIGETLLQEKNMQLDIHEEQINNIISFLPQLF